MWTKLQSVSLSSSSTLGCIRKLSKQTGHSFLKQTPAPILSEAQQWNLFPFCGLQCSWIRERELLHASIPLIHPTQSPEIFSPEVTFQS